MMKSTCSFILILLIVPDLAYCGCCNENYWCDGDPSFREQPTVSQEPNSTDVIITWSEAYLHLAKCVDYFFVQYAPGFNDSDADLNFTMIPITIVTKPLIDQLEEAMNPIFSQYMASFPSEYDTDYLIKVTAVDKGAGWGELEGRALVESKPIHYHSRPFMKPPLPPDPLEEMEETLKRKYPPGECNAHKLCTNLATEWAQDVTAHVARFALPYQDPKTLDPIDILVDEGEEESKRYADGKLHHLKRFQLNVSEAVKINETQAFCINVTLQFRLLRTSYVWQNFFSNGILSMYHTCGQPLPMAIFDDVDLEDVEEIVPDECQFQIIVQLEVPMFPSEKRAKVSNIWFSLKRRDFDFDVTWITSHFHDLEQLWTNQRSILKKVLIKSMNESFASAITFNRPAIWLKKKFRQIDNELMAAKNKRDNNATAETE